jgi:phage major head subunit gpT-like protein
MLINKANLDAIFWQFDTRYQKAYDTTPTFWDKIASSSPSGARETHYGWIGRIPTLRQWLGERKLNNLQARGYVLVNLKFEDSISVPRENIEDDQIGVYAGYLDALGRAAKIWPDQLVTTAVETGKTALCFDGQPFFYNAHPVDMDNPSSTTYQNRFDTSASGGGLAFPLSASNYQTVRQTMMGYVGEDLVPLGINPTLLMVHPSNEAPARQILHADYIAPAGGFGVNAAQMQSNVLKGSAQLLVNPFLTQPDAWYLMDTNRAIMPFVFQIRSQPEFTFLNRPDDPNSFLRDEYLFGVRARGNAGYSLPFLAARASNTT